MVEYEKQVNFTSADFLFTSKLRYNSTVHVIQRQVSNSCARWYKIKQFHGIAIGTLCLHHSVGSYEQYPSRFAFLGSQALLDSLWVETLYVLLEPTNAGRREF